MGNAYRISNCYICYELAFILLWNVFYAMSKISDEEYSELTLLVEDTYVEVEENEKNIEATEVAE